MCRNASSGTIAQITLFYVCLVGWFMKYFGKFSCCHSGCYFWPFRYVCSGFSEGPATSIIGVNLFQEEAARSSETSQQTYYPAQCNSPGDHFQYLQRPPVPQLNTPHPVSKIMRVLGCIILYKVKVRYPRYRPTWPRGSRRLGVPDFMTLGTRRW